MYNISFERGMYNTKHTFDVMIRMLSEIFQSEKSLEFEIQIEIQIE